LVQNQLSSFTSNLHVTQDGSETISGYVVSGVLILNLICRDQSLRQATLEKIHAVFHQVYSCKLQDDVNEVVFALPNGRTTPVYVATDDVSCPVSQSLNNALSSVQDVLQKTMASTTLSKSADVLDLTVKLAGLAML